ncbi:hypothetical protein SAMN05216281_110130, partial [Cryobacterium luteum]
AARWRTSARESLARVQTSSTPLRHPSRRANVGAARAADAPATLGAATLGAAAAAAADAAPTGVTEYRTSTLRSGTRGGSTPINSSLSGGFSSGRIEVFGAAQHIGRGEHPSPVDDPAHALQSHQHAQRFFVTEQPKGHPTQRRQQNFPGLLHRDNGGIRARTARVFHEHGRQCLLHNDSTANRTEKR